MKIYENVWADEPELIEEKYQEIQELYPQVGIALARESWLPKIISIFYGGHDCPPLFAFRLIPTFGEKVIVFFSI